MSLALPPRLAQRPPPNKAAAAAHRLIPLRVHLLVEGVPCLCFTLECGEVVGKLAPVVLRSL